MCVSVVIAHSYSCILKQLVHTIGWYGHYKHVPEWHRIILNIRMIIFKKYLNSYYYQIIKKIFFFLLSNLIFFF